MTDTIRGLSARVARLDRNGRAFCRLIERYRELHETAQEGAAAGTLDPDLARGLAGLLAHLEGQRMGTVKPAPGQPDSE
ncbi:MAG: hypothetical protein AMXMBFR26_22210 [Porticoccaceae bacterium]